jgi:hypothetical protein
VVNQIVIVIAKDLHRGCPGGVWAAGGLMWVWRIRVAFGRPFVANPDLPRRLAKSLPLAMLDSNTLFGGSERGYSDYPSWNDTSQADAVRELEVVS